MAKNSPSIPSGTRDFLPEEMARREFIFETLRSVFRTYGFQPLETPAMELRDTLTGKYGEEGDRLIFNILNNGAYLADARRKGADLSSLPEKALTPQIADRALRYDLTVPFARAVVMNQHRITFPFKRYQIQPVWRADNPQAGRYREFYQCDADVIGSGSLVYDAELAALYDEAFRRLGFPSVRLLVSNRKILSGIAEYAGHPDLLTTLCIGIDKLDKVGEEKVREELVSRGISPEGVDKAFYILRTQGSNRDKLDFLRTAFAHCPTGLQGVAEMTQFLDYTDALGLRTAELIFDLSLARGLDYYTGTIYEVKAVGTDFGGSIGGGGRYDNLTGIFGLNGMSGVGISFGADRIYLVMEKLGLFSQLPVAGSRVMVALFHTDLAVASLRAVTALREAGIPAEIYPEAAKLGKQFGYADKKGIPWVMIIGEEEAKNGTCSLKHMGTGEQQTCTLPEAILKIQTA